ncbi:MAG: hypothetical protein KA156_00285, partial [Paracoccus sp.]|nr:hypothetical protein [Paracoccus sp. (in: a-proteobacteria)]
VTAHARFPNRHSCTKRTLSIQQALEWAFRTEKARLEPPEPQDPERRNSPGFGLEYVLMQRAVLGCRIDGGQYKPDSSTHEDAEGLSDLDLDTVAVLAVPLWAIPAATGAPPIALAPCR